MKALKFTLIVSLLALSVSCKKNANITGAVTMDEATDMAVSAIAQNTFGFALVADNVGVNAQTLYSAPGGQACGTTVADSLTASGSSSSVTYSFFYKYVRTLNCNTTGTPDNLVNAITFHGNFDGPRLTSTDAGTAGITIAGLTPNAASYVLNGTYTRKGAFTSKAGGKATGTSNVEIKAANVLLSKPDRTIVSGSAAITISGMAAGGIFSYNGNLVFNGSNKATLSIGTTVYIINLVTGTYVKQ